ncbi:hypothetical protein HAN_3g511 (nucleomorph) [Hemiselmis andersenii]|uniref:Uncharacterized protein n=3 Tax=Hemiselmis andersenii TaxID=464988 RepID=A9BLC9_HEMAN|nr:hypothetical protein HAN_3g511 [Hemiselmis andersenii]ABW98312.1 hypothetical protein HAN_3g511 [Hemiselmis andersenii]
MSFKNVIEQKIFGETLFLNSIILIKNNFFFLVFSSYIVLAKLFSKIQFSKISDFKIFSGEKKISKIKLNTILETKSKKNSSFIHGLFLFGSKNFEFLFMQTKKKQLFIFSYFRDHSAFFSPKELFLVQGKKNTGISVIDYFKNFFFYSASVNCIQIGQIISFPYLFFRFFKIIKGLNFVIKIKFHSLGIVYSAISKGSFFVLVEKKKKLSHFSIFQIGKLVNNYFFLLSLYTVFSTAEIFIAALSFNKLETFKLSFDQKKKLVSIQLCGSNETITFGNLTSLVWGGIFSKVLFTGDSSGKISIWNELLIPLLEIKNFNHSIKDLKILSDFSSFIVIIKKEKFSYKEIKKKKIFKNIPKTTIKLYAFKKKKNFANTKVMVNLLNSRNGISWIKNFMKIENWKRKKLNELKILSKIGELILIFSYFNKKFSYYGRYFLLFYFQHIMKIYFSKFLKFFNSSYFFRGKFFFFRFFILSKIRNLSLKEIKYEQQNIIGWKKNFFFFTCNTCKRISKCFFPNSWSEILCTFRHLQKNKYMGWEKEKKFYKKRKIYNLWDFEERKIFFPYNFKFIPVLDLKNKSIQKEFSLFSKFKR